MKLNEKGQAACGDCVYSERVTHGAGPMRCRRNAPIPTELANPLRTHWPEVGSGDWCGEWMNRAGMTIHDLADDNEHGK